MQVNRQVTFKPLAHSHHHKGVAYHQNHNKKQKPTKGRFLHCLGWLKLT